jgi:hypothetical protein
MKITPAKKRSNSKIEIPSVLGAPFQGGFYAGRLNVGDIEYAIIVAPKAEGEHADTRWNADTKFVNGALSYNDGLTNTTAMSKAGSQLAQWARRLKIGGFSDWYLPSQDELELCYRHLKPSTDKNYCWARSGINLSAVPPTRPYTPDVPKQTKAKAFKNGGTHAFNQIWHWTSTQHAADPGGAWMQSFGDGSQGTTRKSLVYRARAVRRIKI